MGELMRSVDWSATPVGPVERWPQSLRTVVSILLESRFPMYIAWGPRFTQFYNDGYRPILGATKHPAAMGRSTPDTFPEIWPIIGPMFEAVMRGEAFGFDDRMLPLDRNGYLEECFFTFSYSPIRDESGGVGGVHVTVTETTARVLGERRLRTLRDLAANAAQAHAEEHAWQLAADTLGQHTADLPFALLYAAERDGSRARLMGAAGLSPGAPGAPATVDLHHRDAGADWPLAAALTGAGPQVVTGLAERFPGLGAGPDVPTPTTAVVLPVTPPGVREPCGLLVAGVNPRRGLDDDYRTFLGLVADQLATAVGNARALEEERRRAEALAELDRAKTRFFSNVSHEFRTPLTLLLGPAQELLRGSGGRLPPAIRQQVELIHRNGLRMQRLVDSLLDFAQIEAGRIEARYAPTDLAQLTAELASGFRSAMEQAGLDLRVDCPPLPQPLHVDPEMWEKIVLNLLSNAFKFTLHGSVTVQLRWTGAGAELMVADTGIGIAPEHLPRLFQRFYRIHDGQGRTHEGTGIGLALVQELVLLHGGAVRVTSEPGRGSTFVVLVPAGTAHLPADRLVSGGSAVRRSGPRPFVEEALRWLPTEAVAATPAIPPSGSVERILLADDNRDMREYLARLLAAHWQVTAVADGRDALARALANPPDLVLADVMMPGLDGFELLRHLRAAEATRTLPVILLSARAGGEARLAGIESGADDYLVKPFAARELVARVRTHLQLSRLRRQLDGERQRLRAFLMQAPAIIALTRGPEHVFELSNPLHQRTIGGRDVVGRRAREALPELAGSGAFEILDQVYTTGQPHQAREFPATLPDADGVLHERIFDWSAVPMVDSGGAAEGLMILAFDITEQCRSRQVAEEASRAKDQFLAMLGHELRNPLSPILTALEIMRLRNDGVLVNERTIIARQVAHLTRLIDDLLDVSRITQGKISLRLRCVPLAEVVAKAIEITSPLLEQRHHRLHAAVPQEGLLVEVDEARITQVITNLLNNAAKYTDPGGDIGLRAHADGDAVELAITDTGIGIDPELQPRLFEIFSQGAQTSERSQGGLGIGLTIVRSLVELHGGSVRASSQGRGMGSRFVVRLPLARGRASDATPSPAPIDPPPRPGLRVLVVDDNRDAAVALTDALLLSGYEARHAGDAPAALDLAARFRPQVALVDLGLPVVDGHELAQRLRQVPGLADIRLVAITGYGLDSDRARTRRSGFHAHFVKPVELAQVLAAVSDTPAVDRA